MTIDPPPWPHCGHGAESASDSVGCRGRQVDPHGACLAHLTDADRASYLAGLAPGSDLDHRGTHITNSLLQQLLVELRDPTSGSPRLGIARFDEATFTDLAWFEWATFSGLAVFEGATFSDWTLFEGATFSAQASLEATFDGSARFDRAKFAAEAQFGGATFSGDVAFVETTFSGEARFRGSTFSSLGSFTQATFADYACFDEASFLSGVFVGARFSAQATFRDATFFLSAKFQAVRFEAASSLGPPICHETLHLSGAYFGKPVIIEAATNRLECDRTQWASTAALRLQYATVNLIDAVFEYPLVVTAQVTPFTERTGDRVAEGSLRSLDPGVRLESLRGADAAPLVLHNVDLTSCFLYGTVHLDQLKLEGECPLAPAPSGLHWRGPLPVRWTPRRTLAEEQHWRAAQGRAEWKEAPGGVVVVGPSGLATVYRQLRKSFEDSKNEPDAADFYYGEMEMRRHDRKRPRAERALLALYWAVSRYGLRASRGLGWLLGAMAATVLVMMLWGLPTDDPKPATTGRLTGQDISLTTDKPDPVNPTGPLSSRLTSERLEKSLRVVVNSVVFRSSGQDLTTTGTYTEMASRLTEPVLLGLAALAIRGRVKR
ncbi:pentapeptide repeat-containing protein [Streptomyces sp. NPDC003442]